MNPSQELQLNAAKIDLLGGNKASLLNSPHDALTRKLLREAHVKEAEKMVDLAAESATNEE